MTLKEKILRHLYDNDSGSRILLSPILDDYNDKRDEIRRVLNSLISDGIIDIDNKYSDVSQKEEGQYRDLKFCHLDARLTTPKGHDYVKNLYYSLDRLDNVTSSSATNNPIKKELIAIPTNKNDWLDKPINRNIIFPFLVGLFLAIVTILLNIHFVNK